ncbi:TIGR01906 family membrane protein [Arthrobacter sp. USHLN218]|uniref:TIGR01906 family membrane protein n=1 Tax=Arthrobacter sp. USHLN218 TaxID=3081232 RepID=UPI003015B8F3
MAREDRKADRFEVNRGPDRDAGRLSDGSAGSAPVTPEAAGRTGGSNEGVKAGLGEAPRSGRSFEGFCPDAVPGWGEPTPPGMAASPVAGAAAAASGPEAGGAPGRGEEPEDSTGSNRADKIRFLSGMFGAGREQSKAERDGRRNGGGNAERPADQAGQEGPADQAGQAGADDQAGQEGPADQAGQGRPGRPSAPSSAAREESRDADLKKAARLAAGGAAFTSASTRPATSARAEGEKPASEGRPETPAKGEKLASEGRPETPAEGEKAGSEGRPETRAEEVKPGSEGRPETKGEGTPAGGTPSSSVTKPSGVAVGAAATGVAGAAAVAAQAAKRGTTGKPGEAGEPPRDGEPRTAGGTSGARDAAQTGNPAQSGQPAQGDRPGQSGQPGSADSPAYAAGAARSPRATGNVPQGAPSDEANPDTGSLSTSPPRSEVIKRANQREEALRAKPVAGRILQVVLAVCFPFLLLIGAIRLVCTPLFLWAEYNRPGFPADGFGFSTDDRMTYGSYAVDYLLNWSGPRYLGDLVGTDGRQLFLDTEVGHMADVKTVIMGAWIGGAVLLVLAVLCAIYLARHYPGGIRRGLFAGSVATLLLIVVLGVLGALNWQMFFTEFHRIFFAEGTWTFFTNDTLIRLFPGQFWMDAGIVIGLLVFVVSSLVLAFTWPTKSRRVRSSEKLEATRARYMGEPEQRERP